MWFYFNRSFIYPNLEVFMVKLHNFKPIGDNNLNRYRIYMKSLRFASKLQVQDYSLKEIKYYQAFCTIMALIDLTKAFDFIEFSEFCT